MEAAADSMTPNMGFLSTEDVKMEPAPDVSTPSSIPPDPNLAVNATVSSQNPLAELDNLRKGTFCVSCELLLIVNGSWTAGSKIDLVDPLPE